MNERLKSTTILWIDRRKYGTLPHILIVLLGVCLCGCSTSTGSTNRIPLSGKPLRLVFITCTVDAPFFVPVRQGMNDATGMLGVQCDFKGTPGVDVNAQAEMVRQAVRMGTTESR